MSGRVKAGTGLGLAVLFFALALPFSLWRHLGGPRARYEVSAAPLPESRRAQLDAAVILSAPRRSQPPVEPESARQVDVTPAAPAPARREPEPPLTAEELERLVRDLRDDDIRGNAQEAVETLWALASHPSQQGEWVRQRLDLALWSDDPQQVFFAAQVLYGSEPHPSPRLFEVALSALRDDSDRERVQPFTDNAAYAVAFLRSRIGPVRSDLLERLGSDDPQEQFMAAWVLARTGTARRAKRQVQILAPHLADNDIACDAMLAFHALEGLGSLARPYLPGPDQIADDQARRLLSVLHGWTTDRHLQELHHEWRVTRRVSLVEDRKAWRP